MRYNENDGEEINGKVVITSDLDDNPIFEISCVVVGNLSVETIKANYDLTIIGNVDVKSIEIAGDFTCIGNCNCEDISVQGSCSIEGDLTVESGIVGDELTAKEICAESFEVKGAVSCINMECNGAVACDKYVLIAEGLSGSGSLSSEMTLCGEYSLLDNTTGIFIADTMEMKNSCNTMKTPEDNISEIIDKAKKDAPSKFGTELESFVSANEKYKGELSAYKKLEIYENATQVPNIKVYVDVIDLINRKYTIISNSILIERIKTKFESYTYENINRSMMPRLNKKEFAKLLYVLNFRGQFFDEEIKNLILETLFTYAGIDEGVFQDDKYVENDTKNVVSKEIVEPVITVGKGAFEELKNGDAVEVTVGVWKDTVGILDSIDRKVGKANINIELLGRTTLIRVPVKYIIKK